MYDVIVIGAGFSGAYAALKLKQKGYNILVFEKGSSVICSESTSFNQCYKLHSGVHYFGDAITARKCLIDSITYAKDCSSYLLGNPGSKARRNRHYIMSNSLFNIEEARKIANMLRQTYLEFVQKDPKNKVFGEPDKFIVEVQPEQYPYVAKEMDFITKTGEKEKAKVALAFDVGEPQIDIYRIQKHLQHELTCGEGITSLFNYEVKKIEPYTNGLGYKVTALDRRSADSKLVEFETKGIVNCAWQNIEALDKTAGFSSNNLDRLLIRMKISLLVKLPSELSNMDTCIFSLGPYCSITNLFDGTAVLTYEPVTNLGHYFQDEIPPEKIRQVENIGLELTNSALGKEFADGIINGCSIYVPKMENAELLEVRAGYVKMYVAKGEDYSIYDRNSPIHKRREDGIVLHSNGMTSCYISVSGIKMTYTESNAAKVCRLMVEEMQKRGEWEKIINFVQEENNERGIELLKKISNIVQLTIKNLPNNDSLLLKRFIEQDVLGKVVKNSYDCILYDTDYSTMEQNFAEETAKVFARANEISVAPLLPMLRKDPISSELIKISKKF